MMKKTLLLGISLLFSVGLSAQTVYSDSDDKVDYTVTVEKLEDQTNDRFYEYYSLEVTNKTNNDLTFSPVFNFTTKDGVEKTLKNREGNSNFTIAPGQTIKGDIQNNYNLSLFKSFLVGNSGKKASNEENILRSVSINY